MVKRIVSVAVLLTLTGAWLLPQTASAQAESPLQPVVDPIAEGLAQVTEGLQPVTSQLDPVIAQVLTGIEPLLTQLQGILAQAEPACAALGPVLEGLAPLTEQLQGVLATDVSGLPVVGTLQPVLDTVEAQIDQALGLCAAQATTTTTTTMPVVETPAPVDTLPATGGPGLLVPAFGLLGTAGLAAAARRRF